MHEHLMADADVAVLVDALSAPSTPLRGTGERSVVITTAAVEPEADGGLVGTAQVWLRHAGQGARRVGEHVIAVRRVPELEATPLALTVPEELAGTLVGHAMVRLAAGGVARVRGRGAPPGGHPGRPLGPGHAPSRAAARLRPRGHRRMRGEPMDAQRRLQVRSGLLRLQTVLKGEGASPLDEVSVARRIAQEAQAAFVVAVKAARGAGHSWDRIAEHAPGFGPVAGDDGAQRLFESLTSASGGRSACVSWRCASCDGVIVDRGPYGGHPSDAEHGHLEKCGRHRVEIERYVADLGDAPVSDPAGVDPGAPRPVGQGIDLGLGLE